MTQIWQERIKILETEVDEKNKEVHLAKCLIKDMTEKDKMLVVNHKKEVLRLNEKIEQEKEIAKKGLKELSEMNKKNEKMFSASIYEIEGYMNQLLTEKKGKVMPNIPQLMLSQLAEEESNHSTEEVSEKIVAGSSSKPQERKSPQKAEVKKKPSQKKTSPSQPAKK